jgi:processive 1,2-diacylglycerol beta-glucosyltransferase
MSVNSNPRILILTLPHGAAHVRAAKAIGAALHETRPDVTAEVEDGLGHCARWFQTYYNSYQIPLRYWPSLWGWIESRQHQSASTGPAWLYQAGARPLHRFIEKFRPDAVVATEVGICELVCLHKRQAGATYRLVGVELMDFNLAWVQPEVDRFLCTHPDLAAELVAAGAAPEKTVTTGQPIDPAFASPPRREEARARLGIAATATVLLVLFGGAGFGNAPKILGEIQKVRSALQMVVIAGKNARLETEASRIASGILHARVLGWVDNMPDWMAAADLMVSKPGGGTLAEGFACGLPMLAVDPLPGNEQRTCRWIEKWGAGIWVKEPTDLAVILESLLAHPQEIARLRAKAEEMSRPRAAYAAAEEILKSLEWRP